MRLYKILSNIKVLPTYASKLLLIAFVGIQIPVVGLALVLTYNISENLSIPLVLLLAFGLTFLAAAVNLLALNLMVSPILSAKNALLAYLDDGKLPELPVYFKDEVGVLLSSVQKTLISLDHLLKEKKDMMALLSHDMRSPINTASSLAELIRIKSDDEEIVAYCEKIQQQNTKQIRLFNMVLELLREDEHEHEHIVREKLSLYAVANEVMNTLSLEIGQKELEIKVDIAEDIEVIVQKTAFTQVVVNLMHNAIKFSSRRGTIYVKGGQSQEEVKLTIIDEGMGFSTSEDIEKVFDRFTHLRRKGTEGEPTTGVGLYLSRKIIRRHRGELKAASAGDHKGSTFTITLPK